MRKIKGRKVLFTSSLLLLGGAFAAGAVVAVNNVNHQVYEEVRATGTTVDLSTLDADYITFIRDDVQKALKDLKANYFYASKEAISSSVKQNQKICKAMHSVLSAFDTAYKEKKRKYGLCDFNDLERYTLELLKYDNGSIAKQVSALYDEIYIDEYQDVNSVQDEIFKLISKNNRFMVGDIKQSIYRFRSAEPELFSNYRDTFKDYIKDDNDKEGKRIFMSTNFRCDHTVINAANHVSDYMFLNSRGFTYVPNGDRLKAPKPPDPGAKQYNVRVDLIDESQTKKDDYIKENKINMQAEYVAQEIKRLLKDGKLPNGDDIEEKHIAILLMTKTNIAAYINALTKYGIKHEYTNDISFFEKPHILLMLCLLNAIDNPTRDVYLTGALHSHICDFSLDELVVIKNQSPKEYSLFSALEKYKGDKKLEEKIKNALEKLAEYKNSIRKMSADEAISHIMTETGFSSFCDEEEREDIIKLYNIARSYEQGSYKGLYSFLRYIDDAASKKEMTETVSSDPNNSVKIVTMHKSKGLEYEVCFLCETETHFSQKSYSAPVLFHKNLGICGYISRDGGIIKYNNILRRCVALAIKEAGIEESLTVVTKSDYEHTAVLYSLVEGMLIEVVQEADVCAFAALFIELALHNDKLLIRLQLSLDLGGV